MEAKFKIGQKVFSLKHLNTYRIVEIAINRDGIRYRVAVAGGTKMVDQAELVESVDDAVLQLKEQYEGLQVKLEEQYEEMKVKIEKHLSELKVVAKTLERAIQIQAEDAK